MAVLEFGTSIGNPAFAGTLIFFIGVVAGVCGGFWGVGAGWMVVPALLLFRVSEEAAVAASILHMAVKSVPPLIMQYRKRGKGHVPMLTIGLPMIICSLPMAWLGAPVLHAVKEHGFDKTGVPACYAVILVIIGIKCLSGRRGKATSEGDTCSLSRGRAVAASAVAGTAAGFVNGALGVGGGLLGRPILQHVLGLSEYATVSISQVALLAASGSALISHSAENNLVWPLAIALSLGGIAGQMTGTALSHRALAKGRAGWANLTFAIAVFGVLGATLLKFGAVWVDLLGKVGLVWICIVGLGVCALVVWGALRKGHNGKTESDLVCPDCPLLDI